MKLGLLADIHEEVESLESAIAALRAEGVSRFVILGDVFETGKRLEATVALLSELDAVGVWGNHDFGLCRDVSEFVRRRFSSSVLDYFAGLKPWVEIGDCRFQHIEPYLDSERLEDLWSYGGEGHLDAALSFDSGPHRRYFMGHIHRWAAYSPEGPLAWKGGTPLALGPIARSLIVVHAVRQGWCAWYDTAAEILVPIRIGDPATAPREDFSD